MFLRLTADSGKIPDYPDSIIQGLRTLLEVRKNK